MWWTFISCCVVLSLLLESRRRWVAVRSLGAVADPFLKARAPVERSEQEQRAYVAELNEATLELGAGLAHASSVPRSCAKAALSFGALAALIQSAQLVRGDSARPWLDPALSFVCGCVGALGCAFIGRAADAEARRLRADWATLIRRSAQDVPTARQGAYLIKGSDLGTGLRLDDTAPVSGSRGDSWTTSPPAATLGSPPGKEHPE